MDVLDVIEALGESPGETRKARAALVDYAMMRERSLGKLARMYREQERPPTRRKSTLEKWSSVHNWQHRVSLVDQIDEEKRVELWVQRRQTLDERDWDDGSELRRAAIRALGELDDSPSLVAISMVLQAASKLQRLATGASTDNVALVGQSLIAAIEHELARLGYDETAGGVPVPEGAADPRKDPTG